MRASPESLPGHVGIKEIPVASPGPYQTGSSFIDCLGLAVAYRLRTFIEAGTSFLDVRLPRKVISWAGVFVPWMLTNVAPSLKAC